MLAGEIKIKSEISKAISSFINSINNTSVTKLNNLFSKIVYDTDIDIPNWKIEDYDHFLREIDLVNNCHDNSEVDTIFTKKYIPNILISFIASLQDIPSNNDDINNHLYDIIINYLYDRTNGDIKSIVSYIIPLNIQDLPDESSITIMTLLISSLKTFLSEKDKGIKELLQNVLNKINEIDMKENEKINNSEYLDFMLSLFSELFKDIELRKIMKLLWEVTNGNTEQMAEYISYLLYKQDNQKEDNEGAESKHFGQATRIVIEEYIEPLQQKQRRQIIRNRNKISESASTISSQTEEEAANADLNEIFTFIKQVLHYTCLDDDQHGYPKELALFFSSFEDFWEPDMILKFILDNEDNKKAIEDNYKEYYGPFLMDLADLMNWTNKQCETALLVLTEGWKRKSRISIAKMMGLSVNDIKHLYSDCKDLTYNDADYLSENEDNESENANSERNNENELNSNGDSFKTKKPVVLSIRGSDFKRSFTKPLTEKDNVGAGNNIICRYYGTPRGCTSGINCPFKHIQTRSSYITRRLNHTVYSSPKPTYSGKFVSSPRYHNNGIINNIVKHKSSFQNSNFKSTSIRNNAFTINEASKNRLNNRISIDSLPKFNKKGGEYEPHEKIDTPYGKSNLIINNKLRKQASCINFSSSYRNQAPKEYKPIEAIDPAVPQHSHSNIICYFYNDPRGCSNGANCKFLHINANTNRNYETGRNSYGYDNSTNKKPYNSNGSYKSYNNIYPNYSGSEGLRGQQLNRKISRNLLRNNDPKLNQEYNTFNRNINEDNQLKDTNITTKLNDEDKSVITGKDINQSSITIVNSSQNVDITTKDETKNEIFNNESNVINQPNPNFTISNSKTYSLTPCIYFNKEGSCKYGDRCKFLHLS